MDKVVYAVHTRSCTFLLDAEGLCHWIVSRTGVLPPDVRGCVGAQFVACLHPELPGFLAGELVLGAAALFTKHEEESGRAVLMRSGEIVHVEQRGAARSAHAGALSDDTLDLKGGPGSSTRPPPAIPAGYERPAPPQRYGSPPSFNARGGDTVPPPPPSHAGSFDGPSVEELDVEPDPSAPALRPLDSESTVTLTLPLFRPDAPRRV
jgi:hypothetical protein